MLLQIKMIMQDDNAVANQDDDDGGELAMMSMIKLMSTISMQEILQRNQYEAESTFLMIVTRVCKTFPDLIFKSLISILILMIRSDQGKEIAS